MRRLEGRISVRRGLCEAIGASTAGEGKEWRGGEGGVPGGLPPPVGETSSTRTSRALCEWEGLRGGSPAHQNRGIGPRCVPGRNPSIPGSCGPGDQKRGGRGDLHPFPPSVWWEGEREAGEGGWNGLERRWECPSPCGAVVVSGRGGVTNPASKRDGIGGIADAAEIGRAGGTSPPRGVNLSEEGSPESAPRRPRRRWGAAGNRPPPILESGERPMASTAMGGGCERGTERSPLRRLERSEGGKTPNPREGARGGGVAVLKIRVHPPGFVSSSSAETPMSCKQRWGTAGNVSGSNSPQVVFLQFPPPSTPGADGEPGPPGLPDFGIGGKADAAHRDGQGTGGYQPRGLPSAHCNDRKLEGAPINANGRGVGRAGFENSGPWTRIFKQLIGGNADELQKGMGKDGRRFGERVSPSSIPKFPLQSAAAADGGVGEAVPRIGDPPPPGEFRLQSAGRRRRTSEGTSLRSSAPLVSRHSARSANSLTGGPGWPPISIGRRSLGSAPIENPRPSSDSGGRPASVGRGERSEGRSPSEQRAELGGGRGGLNNRP